MLRLVLLLLVTILNIEIVASQPFYSRTQWETYFTERGSSLEPIEGVWSLSRASKGYNSSNELIFSNNDFQHVQDVAIYRKGNDFILYELNNDIYEQIKFNSTANSEIFILEIFYSKGLLNTVKSTAILSSNVLLEYSYKEPTNESRYRAKQNNAFWPSGYYTVYNIKLLKVFPSSISSERVIKSSGTGFAISSNGVIATNYHVINDKKSIKVRGVNSDFGKSYNAKVILSDRNNDLALIQIDDNNFTSLDIIPYKISMELSEVGENIFVLGYPLRATMGDEIKLTNGIISSRSGFQGDITTYQISAPVQPGNSGGPLFNSKGNLIGIINSKHTRAENASYAIKINYLTSLINLLPNPPNIEKGNALTGKTLSQQVEILKKFVFIIETE
jgi:S1-C subfamily serine protease